MTKPNISDKAQRDLLDIYGYGIENYGYEGAEKYYDTIFEKLWVIAQNPTFGNDYSEVLQGMRRYECVSHAIYYRETEGCVEIIRILHGRMDPGRHIT